MKLRSRIGTGVAAAAMVCALFASSLVGATGASARTVDAAPLVQKAVTAQQARPLAFRTNSSATLKARTGAQRAAATSAKRTGRARRTGKNSNQAALAAQATVTKQQAEQIALSASPGNTIDHSRLAENNGTIFWDVDFTNGGGVTVNAQTGAVIAREAAGTDHGTSTKKKPTSP